MRKRIEQPVVKLILKELEFGPSTLHDLVDVIKINARNLRVYLKIMLEIQMIHISAWEQRQGPALPVFNIGKGRNYPRPKVMFQRRSPTKEIQNESH